MKKIKIVLAFILLVNIMSVYAAAPVVNSRSSILMEISSGKVLYENHPDDRVPIASVTKVMTVLLAMEAIERGELNYDDIITASSYAESMGGSQIYLAAGEEMTVDDILKAVVVASGNDAAVALAEHIGGTYENFVSMMNERAKELGLKNTHFVEANGLSDDKNHYSSARDVGIMSCELMKHKEIIKYTKILSDTLRNGEFNLVSTNKLMRTYEGATGLKTGYTSEALNCLVATAERDGVSYCAVVLGAPTTNDRFDGCENLLDYGYENFIIADTVCRNEVVGQVRVLNGKTNFVNAVMKDDVVAIIEKESPSVERKVSLNKNAKAPVEQGDVLGKVEFYSGDKVVAETELIAETSVAKKSYFEVFSVFSECFQGIY